MIKSFKRYEKKFIISKDQYDQLIPKLLNYMNIDKHCINNTYSIYNIYYDTKNSDVIRHSISKPYYKEKLRLRSYTIPEKNTDTVFLELKKKINGIVSKRRAVLTLEEATNFLKFKEKPECNDYVSKQVIEEIHYYLSHTKIQPTVYIGYERIAFFGKDNSDFRITFDSNITTRRHDLHLQSGMYGQKILPNDEYLMEVKILGSIPLWLTRIFSELKIYNTHFSKYGNEYMNFCKQKNNKIIIAREITC
ncbi:VTC domain-containing protein [Clostridium bornimense]|uniref:VTC domain-containing protein n=1 Tax=Clostridium bornimense TaxID=1216932 RepID=W6SCC2_9CLOT|nr:polyphosphate polymerase domain-containing protein [Clostridium bornimense]CDM67275.1 VTC domain-containing protein [Clostridium bornimense]